MFNNSIDFFSKLKIWAISVHSLVGEKLRDCAGIIGHLWDEAMFKPSFIDCVFVHYAASQRLDALPVDYYSSKKSLPKKNFRRGSTARFNRVT